MVIRACIALAALSACVHPDYFCTSDADCDVGESGRCELDRRCTAFDPLCPTHRRYSDNSGPPSNSCFDDSAPIANVCAAGQPPATPDQCTTAVCDALPTCCSTGWSEPCVQQAQLLCNTTCDTRIAITANRAAFNGASAENQLWDVRWNGTQWTATQDSRQSVLAWLAPLPGSQDPQLAAFKAAAFLVGNSSFPVDKANNYIEATSVDFDRDGRPTAALGFTLSGTPYLQLLKLDDGSARVIATAAATRLSWGDIDHDAFPDGIAADNGTSRYFYLANAEADDRSRRLDTLDSMTVSGGITIPVTPTDPTPPPLRSFDWLDVNADHLLDAVAFGYSVDVHAAQTGGIATATLNRYDCDPPAAPGGTCTTALQANESFAGAALPAADGPALILSGASQAPTVDQPSRAVFRVDQRTPLAPPKPYTFPSESCTSTTCAPILAVVVRDLDGDHKLDVIAIDADLQIYVALGNDPSLTMHAAIKLPTIPTAPDFTVVRTSVTGAPR